MAFLVVESGPEAGPVVGTRHELSGPGYVKLGRNPDCNIVIHVGAVSRDHAEIRQESGVFYVRDLQSRNGTYVNDELIRDQRPLKHGDRVRICDVSFAFEDDRPHLAQTDSVGGGSGAVLVDDDSSGSTIMSKVEVSTGSSGLQVAATPEAKLAALLEIIRSLGKAVALDEVLPQLLEGLFKIFVQADRGFIVLQTPDGGLAPRWTKTRRNDDDTIRISKTIVKQVMDTKEAILSADAASDERFEMSQSLADFRIRSMMCVPLVNSDDEAIGVLQIDTLDQRKRFSAEDLEVLASVASQAGIAITNAQLHEQALRQKGLERDLELAHDVQKSFLPHSRPQIAGYEFFDFYQPANHVGGDYFDYIPLPDGRTAVIVADVVGHGVAAALLMAKLATESRFCLATAVAPANAVTMLNDSVAELPVDRFVTLVMTVIDPVKHEVTIVNAGHMCPIVRRPDGSIVEPGEEQGGLPVGVLEDADYQQLTIKLEPGESVTMYTDGLNEAMDASDQQFGTERIRDHVKNGGNLVEMGRAIIDDVLHYMADGPQEDDMCLVCYRREA